ncbi:MAG: hypothetical protein IJH04_11805 [Eggerthellaceae bacterium]|nr:hypothetical protein [Eggerthellaceae bacterium]
MARDFRSSRFRGRAGIGEDVNPSAYIVNLADCMLVLACGFLVALISLYNIDVMPATELDENNLEQVDPESMPEDLVGGGGTYYVEAGKVYRDPNTGVLYMIENPEALEGSQNSASSPQPSTASGSDAASPAANPAPSATNGSTGTGTATSGTESIRNARANGAD